MRKSGLHIVLLSLLSLAPLLLSAEGGVKFTQNLGQWEDPSWYRAELPSGFLWAESKGLTYMFYDSEAFHERFFHGEHPEGKRPEVLDCHAFKLEFQGAEARQPIATDVLDEYRNYFLGNDPARWQGHVPVSQGIRYDELWPGIDFHLYGQEGGLKYDLLLAAGADPADIRLRYKGLDDIQITQDGRLVLRTSLNTLVEQAPVAWQLGPEGRIPLDCRFRLRGSTVSFEFPYGYDPGLPVVIDPTVIFSTYTGSTADNFGYTATFDQYGALISGGIAFAAGYPVTTGAYQTTFGGGGGGGAFSPIDMAISKFEANSLIWSTYVGGTGNEQPHSLVTDDWNNLFIYGKAYSTDYPVGANAYDPTHNGGADIVVSKLSPDGSTLLGSTFIGGSADDGLNITSTSFGLNSLKRNYGDDSRGEVVVDWGGFCYVATSTQSTDFPVSASAAQNSLGGSQDGAVMKLSPDLDQLLWATYLGGANNDAAYSLKVDKTSQVYVTGGTESADFPVTGSAYQQNYGGNIDGYITRINPQGTVFMRSTYIGTSSYDQCYFIEKDDQNNIYVLGQTAGVSSFPVTPGVWSVPNSGQFITKLDGNLNGIIYSTTFGNGSGAPNISPTAFMVDVCEYVYVSGWGGSVNTGYINGSTNNMPLTADAVQTTTDGSDLYVMVLQKDAVALDFATYMGGSVSREHVDGGTSRFSNRAEIYQAVCAGCWGNSDFPTLNAYSSTNNSTGCNLAAFKVDFPLPGILADFDPVPATAGCMPHTVGFQNQSWGGVNYYWDYGDGTTFTGFNGLHTYTTPGTFLVTLVAEDVNSCNVTDTAYKTVTVWPKPVAEAGPDTSVCMGQAVMLNGSGAGDYSWTPTPTLSDPFSATPLAGPIVTTQYLLTITNQYGCQDQDSVTVQVHPNPTANAGADTEICADSLVQLSGSGGGSYLWQPGTGLSDSTIADPVASPTGPQDYVLTVTTPFGCEDSDTVSVDVTPKPVVNLVDSVGICELEDITLTASGGESYLWSTGDTGPSITVSPPGDTFYVVTAFNDDCPSEPDTVFISYTAGRPTADFDMSIDSGLVPLNVDFTNQSTNASSYFWIFDHFATSTDTNPSYSFPEAGDYNVWLIAISDGGCRDTALKVIRGYDFTIWVPSGFSPNGDGINDTWSTPNYGVAEYHLMLFDRWGMLIYETYNKNFEWPGDLHGKVCQEGVYTYVITGESVRGEPFKMAGNVTLIR